MSRNKTRSISIYRDGIEKPIVMLDKSSIDDETLKNMLSNVFSSPQISVVETSSGTIILRPSRITAIEITDIKNKKENEKLKINDLKTDVKYIDVTAEKDENNKKQDDVKEDIIKDEINIENITVNVENTEIKKQEGKNDDDRD